MHQFHSFSSLEKWISCIGLAPINFMILTQWECTQPAICMVSSGFVTVTNNTVQMDFHLFMIFTIFRDSLRTFVGAAFQSQTEQERNEKNLDFLPFHFHYHFSYHSLCVCVSFSFHFLLVFFCWQLPIEIVFFRIFEIFFSFLKLIDTMSVCYRSLSVWI